MTLLKILTYPDKTLLKKSVKVDKIDDHIKRLVNNMGETMFASGGLGLAAPQIGINKRIIVYDINVENKNTNKDKNLKIKQEYKALINPEISDASNSMIYKNEGCLSVPDYNADIKRYEKVVIKALDIEGKQLKFNMTGVFSVIMQHEIDHLNGVLFIDKISVLKRAMYKKKMKKAYKQKK